MVVQSRHYIVLVRLGTNSFSIRNGMDCQMCINLGQRRTSLLLVLQYFSDQVPLSDTRGDDKAVGLQLVLRSCYFFFKNFQHEEPDSIFSLLNIELVILVGALNLAFSYLNIRYLAVCLLLTSKVDANVRL